MTLVVPEFNAADTEQRIQIDSGNSALKVYTGGAWQTHTFGTVSSASRDVNLLGTASPLLAESVPLWACTNNATALTTGTMLSVALYLPKGLLVTSFAHLSGTTALAAPTHESGALYDTSATPALIASSVVTDLTNTNTWAAYTMMKHTLGTPYKVPTAGVYYVSLTITGTVPTLMSTVAVPSLNLLTGSSYQTGAFDQVVRSGSALAGVPPATITSTTVLTFTPWVGIF